MKNAKRRNVLLALTAIVSVTLLLNYSVLSGQHSEQPQQQKEAVAPVSRAPPAVQGTPTVPVPAAKDSACDCETRKSDACDSKGPSKAEASMNDTVVVNIPVVVVACKRASYLERALDSLLKYLPKGPVGGVMFSIIVSRDCKSPEVESLVGSPKYSTRVSNMRFLPPGEVRTMADGYAAIARHYGWIFTQLFDVLHYRAAVIVEEDMEVSPDFYEYFAAGYKLLNSDPTLWCISSWNDNGLGALVSDPYALYRSDFFPGLGWMLLSSLWTGELRGQWPAAYWDDYLRRSEVRKGRACIRPELSRTFNFGENGVSQGQFYSTHLAHIAPNTLDIKWSQMDLAANYTKESYDKRFISGLKNSRVVNRWQDLLNAGSAVATTEKSEESIVVPYHVSAVAAIAKQFGLMEDLKDGIPRTAYMGVITFKWKGCKINLVPTDLLNKIKKE